MPNSTQTPLSSPVIDPLRGSMADFARPSGSDLIARTAEIVPYIRARASASLWPYSRVLSSAPGTTMTGSIDHEQVREGLNFGSQDYLSLSAHPDVHDAAVEAIRRYGVHSASSGALQGRSDQSVALERDIGDMLGCEHVVLFPTGWGAAYGVVTALVRPDDHVVVDRLAHASLRAGASAATRKVTQIEHLSVEGLRSALTAIRGSDAADGILVISEGLFSMDSDCPDLRAMQAVCREYGATFLVDVAHDFGSIGPDGSGHIGRSGMLGGIDIVMGAFSKTCASNGGFVATSHAGVAAYVAAYGGPHMFSNALSPVQVAVVRAALRIIRSPEGDLRRAALRANVDRLRRSLGEAGLTCLGEPSPIVPVLIGRTPLARVASRSFMRRGLFANLIEFPAVGIRAARFRLQVQADHSPEQAEAAAAIVAESVAEGRAALLAER